jgi:hypothetical protein
VVISYQGNRHPVERSFQAVLTVAPEQQPCGVQVVERVALFAHLSPETGGID